MTPVPSFIVPAELMQGIVTTIGNLPWNQAQGLMGPLVQLCQEQQKAHEAASDTWPDCG
jgi:hypothetical protein